MLENGVHNFDDEESDLSKVSIVCFAQVFADFAQFSRNFIVKVGEDLFALNCASCLYFFMFLLSY